MKEAVIRMETAARPTTDRSASPRLLKGLLLAITLVALLATTVILCQQDIENPSYVYMILDETGMQIIDGRPDGDVPRVCWTFGPTTAAGTPSCCW